MVIINVAIFALFSANWSDYSSKLQTRSIGLKTPFPTFSFFSPTPQNTTSALWILRCFLRDTFTPY